MATVTREQRAIEAWAKAMATAENYAVDPHQHIARLVEAGEQMAALLAPKDAAALASPPASDPPGPTVINEDDGDVTIDFDYANDRVVSIRLGEESSGLSAFVDGESHALCPLDRVPPKVLALLRTEAKAVTLRQSDPPGLVANWRPIETAPKRTDVLAGWADRPHWLPQVLQQDDAGMWFNGEESDYRPPTHWMPLPASPQAKED